MEQGAPCCFLHSYIPSIAPIINMNGLRRILTAPADLSTVPAPPETHNWRLYTMALSASCASACFGYDSSFIGGTIKLDSFTRTFGITDANETAISSHLTSLFQAGAFFGAILVYPITERFGRRPALIIAALVFCVGAILQTVSNGNIPLMYGARVLSGLGVGSSSLVTPNYISENSTPALRGQLVGLFEIILQVSLVFGFWIVYGVKLNIPDDGSNKQWQIPFALQLIPGGLLIICMLIQSESPRWLIKKGKLDQARAVLSRIRHLESSHPYLDYEIQSVQAQIAKELGGHSKPTFFQKVKEALGKRNRSRLGLGVALMWLQNLSGINSINYYSNTLITKIGFTGDTVSLLATGVFGIVKMVSTLLFMFFVIDKVGRRKPLLFGSIFAAFAMFYIGAYSVNAGSFDHTVPKDGRAYFALVSIYIFGVSYCCSWNAIPWIFQSEVFGMNVRALSMVVTTCAQWLSQFVIVYSTPYMIADLKGWTFIFFGLWVCFGMCFAYLFVPETKEISLEDMDILFAGPVLASKKREHYNEVLAAKRIQIEQSAGRETLAKGQDQWMTTEEEKAAAMKRREAGLVSAKATTEDIDHQQSAPKEVDGNMA